MMATIMKTYRETKAKIANAIVLFLAALWFGPACLGWGDGGITATQPPAN
jgi:hypothetical protein